jgi:hypothetical protein
MIYTATREYLHQDAFMHLDPDNALLFSKIQMHYFETICYTLFLNNRNLLTWNENVGKYEIKNYKKMNSLLREPMEIFIELGEFI